MRAFNKISHGFTLLETLLAMMLLSIALVLLVNSWSAAFNRVKKTQTNFEMGVLLERKMGEIEREYSGKPLAEIPDSKEDNFGDEYPQFSWKMKSKNFEFPDISSIMTANEGGVDQMTQSVVKQMTDQISKSIKEVTVTITLKHPKKNIEAAVTTYFVDYDKGVSLGVPGQ